MSLMEVPFEQVDEAALQRLVDNQVRESLAIEYKQELPGRGNDDRREYLRDVTAFANADGGDLLFGVRDEDGVAAELVGVEPDSMDTEIGRISNLVRDAIDPRIHGLNIRAVPLAASGHVVHVRVPRSLDVPHMVQLGNYRQFWMRGPVGKYSMSTSDVRNAVMRTENWGERADQWRRERVDMVEEGNGPVLLRRGGRLHVHAVPMFGEGTSLNLADARTRTALSETGVLRHRGWNYRMMYEGFLLARELPGTPGKNRWYRMWHHDGSLEHVSAGLAAGNSNVDMLGVEHVVVGTIRTLLDLDVPGVATPPFLLFITLAGVEGAAPDLPHGHGYEPHLCTFDRDVYFLPGLFTEARPDDDWQFVAPALNRLWQAGGVPNSPYFNADGTRAQGFDVP